MFPIEELPVMMIYLLFFLSTDVGRRHVIINAEERIQPDSNLLRGKSGIVSERETL